MRTHTILVMPDGMAHCLYTEAIDLSAIGKLQIRRASTIEFDNESQLWRVRDMAGKGLHSSSSRDECIDWEQEHVIADRKEVTEE